MIVYALILFTILFFLSWNLLMSKHSVHIATSVVTTILLLMAIVFSISNFNHHYGMHLVDHDNKTKQIASVSKQSPMLVYEKLGSARKHEIVIYKNANHKKKQHTTPDVSVQNQIVKTNSKRPYLRSIHRNWQYRSNMMRFWFGLAQKSQRYSTINRFYVPRSWNVLSVNQVKVMGRTAKKAGLQNEKTMASAQGKMMLKQKAQAYVKSQVTKAMQKNPHMNSKQKNVIMKQAEKSFKTKLKARAVAKIMPQALKAAKKAPISYAK